MIALVLLILALAALGIGLHLLIKPPKRPWWREPKNGEDFIHPKPFRHHRGKDW